MITLWLVSCVWIVCLAGWGRLCFGKLIGPSFSLHESWALYTLLGHLPVIALGFVVHFFLPLAGWLTTPIALAGLMTFLWGERRATIRTLVLFFLLAAIVSLFASRAIIHGDSAHYGIPAVAWMADEPIVKGLANLDPAYGYNSAWWIVAALMAWPLGVGMAVQAVSIPFLTASGLLIGVAIARVVKGKGTWADWYLVPAFYLWFRQMVGVNTPSPASDIPANLSIILAFWVMVKALTNRQATENNLSRPSASGLPILFIAFATLAFSAKISAALVLAVGGFWFVASFVAKPSSLREQILPLALISLLIFSQLLHGLFLSGFPLFPSGVGGCFDVPWRVDSSIPGETVQRAKDWAQTFGAGSDDIANTPRWKLWIQRQGAATNLAMAGLVGVVGVLAAGYVTLKNKKEALRASCLALPAVIAAGLLIWNFVHAPALRFGAGYAFALLGCLSAFAGPLLPILAGRLVVLLWIVACVGSMGRLATERPPTLWSPRPLPQSVFEEWKTNDGAIVHVPPDGLLWLGQKPATVPLYFKSNLQILRSPDSKRITEFRTSGK